MKNRIIGLGIFALVFSFNLLFSGLLGTHQVIPEHLLPLCNSFEQEQAVQPSLSELTSPEGILQSKTEISEMHQQVRKFPALVSVLFSLFYANGVGSFVSISAADLSVIPLKDFPVAYHNLRI